MPKTLTETLPRRLYSVKDAAEMVSASPKVIYRLIYGGQLASVKLGRRRLIPAEALEAFIAELKAS